MITYQDINNLIASIGVPYAYYQFPEGTGVAPPFICFYYDQQIGFAADNTNFAKPEHLVIELYTNNKDFQLEAQIEKALNDIGLVYSRMESYIDSEKLFLQTFESEVLINGQQQS